MAEKKDTGFTVTDRRLFTEDGELRKDVAEPENITASGTKSAATETKPAESAPKADGDAVRAAVSRVDPHTYIDIYARRRQPAAR